MYLAAVPTDQIVAARCLGAVACGDRLVVATPAIYFGTVVHHRLRPCRHRFHYPVYFLRVPVDDIDSLRRPLFSVDRFNVFSFYRKDHGPRDGSDLGLWIRDLLAREGLANVTKHVELQAYPRVLGYVFNPVSFWFCRDDDGVLRAVLCAVNNTFGESHSYLVAHPDGRPLTRSDTLTARKVLHVSPFFPTTGEYRFRFHDEGKRTLARIDYGDADGALLLTSVTGTGEPLTSGRLVYAFFRYPWFTLGVIARIHYQALKLWLKRVPFFSKPAPPSQELTR